MDTTSSLLEALNLDLPTLGGAEEEPEVPELEASMQGQADDYRYRDGPGGAHEHFPVFY